MGRTNKASSGCLLAAVSIALSSCGASGEAGSPSLEVAEGAVNGRGGASGGAGSSAPTVVTNAPGVAEIASSSPSAPPVTSGLPGVEVPDFSGFSPGSATASGASGCQQAQRNFDPQIPTVFLLVDRSGTMFDTIPGANVTAWGALRTGALEVIRELASSVSFGFGAFSGQTLAAQACDLEVPTVPPALDNYDAIAQLYTSLERPANPDSKETPTALALASIAEELEQNPDAGDKYILFVTDGEPDFCDNGNALCPPDPVVGLLQSLAAEVDAQGLPRAPIRTLVFGITSPTATIRLPILQGFANAGAGQPVAPLPANPGQPYDPNALFDQCNGDPNALVPSPWNRAFVAAKGRQAVRGESVGAYVTDPALAGTAPVYRPDPNDQAALTEQIRAALAGVKSCTFDLAADGVQVDISRQDLGTAARVLLEGNPVPFDPVNGWHMLSGTTVQLEGAACESWRVPGATSLDFDFPCDLIIIR